MHKVSTVIPCYNYGHFLAGAIESVLAQTYPAHEIIVVDDGSTDDTPDVVKQFAGSVRSLRTENRGVASARNSGVEAATGDLIAFLDADDRWLPEKLARQLALFERDPKLGLVHSGSRVFDHDTGATNVEIRAEPSLTFHDLLRNCSVSLPSTIVPTRIFHEVGGFNTALANAADWDLWLRIAAKYAVAAVPEVLVEYREHCRSMSRGNEAKQFREALTVLARGEKVHGHCTECAAAAAAARRRLAKLFYGVSAAAARHHARKGEYWESFRRRVSPFWHYPRLVFSLPTFFLETLQAWKTIRRLKAEQAGSATSSARPSADPVLPRRDAREFEIPVPKA